MLYPPESRSCGKLTSANSLSPPAAHPQLPLCSPPPPGGDFGVLGVKGGVGESLPAPPMRLRWSSCESFSRRWLCMMVERSTRGRCVEAELWRLDWGLMPGDFSEYSRLRSCIGMIGSEVIRQRQLCTFWWKGLVWCLLIKTIIRVCGSVGNIRNGV